MNEDLTDSQKLFLDNIQTSWRKNWWRNFFLGAREENSHIIVPAGVDAWREFNKTLREMEDKLKNIEACTNKSNSVLKSIANIFKFGGSEMEQQYPKQEKHK